jgi:hypothetical protein
MTILQGHLEQRSQERISAMVNVNYRLLGGQEKLEAIQRPIYNQTTTAHFAELANKFHVYRAVTTDLAEGELSLTGDNSFSVGDRLEISILPPKYIVPVIVLSDVKHTRSFMQLGKVYCTAGVEVLALNSESMSRLNLFLFSEQIRRDGARPRSAYA